MLRRGKECTHEIWDRRIAVTRVIAWDGATWGGVFPSLYAIHVTIWKNICTDLHDVGWRGVLAKGVPALLYFLCVVNYLLSFSIYIKMSIYIKNKIKAVSKFQSKSFIGKSSFPTTFKFPNSFYRLVKVYENY